MRAEQSWHRALVEAWCDADVARLRRLFAGEHASMMEFDHSIQKLHDQINCIFETYGSNEDVFDIDYDTIGCLYFNNDQQSNGSRIDDALRGKLTSSLKRMKEGDTLLDASLRNDRPAALIAAIRQLGGVTRNS